MVVCNARDVRLNPSASLPEQVALPDPSASMYNHGTIERCDLNRHLTRFLISLAIILIILSACDPLAKPVQPSATLAEPEPPTETLQPTPVPPTATPTEESLKIGYGPEIPEELIQSALSSMVVRDEMEASSLIISFIEGDKLSEWIFALVAPFATVPDSIDAQEWLHFWQTGEPRSELKELVVDLTAFHAFLVKYGMPASSIKSLPPTEIFDYCRENNAWAIIPFERITPEWKVIAIDGQSPIHKYFDPSIYPLKADINLSKNPAFEIDPETYQHVLSQLQAVMPKTNRDPEKLTTVILTGVTALARATAKEMEIYGVLSPAQSIKDVMKEADLAHVSNEVPFAPDCPEPQWVQDRLEFCSDDSYIDLLKEIGTDVVELTGDHFRDWGPEAMLHTLDMYDAEGWSYYGGGRNIAEARAPLRLEHNGNKIAFIGCNAKAPGYATASETNPGAFHCDMDYMVGAIEGLVQEGYLVIATFQHDEVYQWQPAPNMIEDFRQLAEAGAVIVSGSQAHQPHIYEFWGDTFVHYGLGNLFFDQLGWYDDSDKAFIDRHIFYDGKYLGVELLTIQFFNWSTPTWMTPDARTQLLARLFEQSQQFSQAQ